MLGMWSPSQSEASVPQGGRGTCVPARPGMRTRLVTCAHVPGASKPGRPGASLCGSGNLPNCPLERYPAGVRWPGLLLFLPSLLSF